MPTDEKIPLEFLLEPHDAMRFKMDDERMNELIDSIRHDGLLSPLFVIPATPTPELGCVWPDGPEGEVVWTRGMFYQIRAGHRRLLACRALLLSPVPCRVFQPGEPGYAGLMATENLIREECTPFEEGNMFATIAEIPGITEEELRRRCGHKSLPYIYDRIALVRGDEAIALAVHEGQIAFGVAKKLNMIRYPAPGQHGEKLEGEALHNAVASADAYRASFLERAISSGATIATVDMWLSQWRMSAGIIVQSGQPAAEPMPPGGYPLPSVTCALCGETDEPGKMETISVHRSELAAFRAALAQQGVGK